MNCYLCGSSSFKKRSGEVRDNPALDVIECQDCGLVTLSSFEHITENFYSDSKMHGNNPLPVKDWQKETDWDDQRRFDYLKSLITNKEILDFGCGASGFLKKASMVSDMVKGVEAENRIRSEIGNSLSIFSCLEELKNNKFDD